MRKLRFRKSIWLALGYTSRQCWSELELRTSEARLRLFSFHFGSLLPCPPELLLIEKLAGIKRSTVTVVKLTEVCCSNCIWKLIDPITLPAVGGSGVTKSKWGARSQIIWEWKLQIRGQIFHWVPIDPYSFQIRLVECVPFPVFLPGKFHGQRNLAGYSPRGHKESDKTEGTKHIKPEAQPDFIVWLNNLNFLMKKELMFSFISAL